MELQLCYYEGRAQRRFWWRGWRFGIRPWLTLRNVVVAAVCLVLAAAPLIGSLDEKIALSGSSMADSVVGGTALPFLKVIAVPCSGVRLDRNGRDSTAAGKFAIILLRNSSEPETRPTTSLS